MGEIEQTLHLSDLNIKSIEYAKINDRKSKNIGDGLNLIKSQIQSIKCGVVESRFPQLFCDALEDSNDNKENWCTVDEAEKRDQMNESKKELENSKKQMAEVEEAIKKRAEEIQARYESIQEEKLVLQNKLFVINEKEKKLNKLEERRRALEEDKKLHFGGSEKHESKDGLQETWEQAHGAMKQCLAAIDTLNEYKLLLEVEQTSLLDTCQRLQEMLLALKMKEKKSLKRNREQERLRSVIDILASISGLRITDIINNSVTIEIQDVQYHKESSSQETRPSILLTLKFILVDDQFIVDDVQTNSLTFFIKDLIEQVKSTIMWKFFILEVQNRFHNQAKLLKEMKILRERFAIDWNIEKQTVRVMLGKSGQIVCTLKVHDGYPMTGHISVEEINGADPSILMQDTLMTDELKSLTSWIEYISIKFGSL